MNIQARWRISKRGSRSADMQHRQETIDDDIARPATQFVQEVYPLRLSRGLRPCDRVGSEPPILVCKRVESILAADLHVHGLGHGYYGETKALLYDPGEFLHDNAPERSHSIGAASAAAEENWVFRRWQRARLPRED
jgi:hypothetical protein